MSNGNTSIVFVDATHGTLAVEEEYGYVRQMWHDAKRAGEASFEVTRRNGRPIAVSVDTIRTITPLVSDTESGESYIPS